MGGTLTPMAGLWLHNPETEALRAALNRWVRTSGKLDAVADFDAATRGRRPNPSALVCDFDSGGRVRPNDAGSPRWWPRWTCRRSIAAAAALVLDRAGAKLAPSSRGHRP